MHLIDVKQDQFSKNPVCDMFSFVLLTLHLCIVFYSIILVFLYLSTMASIYVSL